jgi:outer membrane protein
MRLSNWMTKAALVVGVMLVAAGASYGQSLKIGVFDAQKIFEQTAAGAKVNAELTALQQDKQQELEQDEQQLQELQQQLLSSAASLSQEKLKQRRLEIERKANELEAQRKSAMRELQVEFEEAQARWERRIRDIVRDYGDQQGFTLILPVGAVVFHANTIDITDELIEIVDAQQQEGAAGS